MSVHVLTVLCSVWFLLSYTVFAFLQYYAETHAVIYVVDSSDRDRIEESKMAFGMYLLDFTKSKEVVIMILTCK